MYLIEFHYILLFYTSSHRMKRRHFCLRIPNLFSHVIFYFVLHLLFFLLFLSSQHWRWKPVCHSKTDSSQVLKQSQKLYNTLTSDAFYLHLIHTTFSLDIYTTITLLNTASFSPLHYFIDSFFFVPCSFPVHTS